MCSTVFLMTCSMAMISSPLLFCSLPLISKSGIVLIVSSVISFIYSTIFLQSLICLIGPLSEVFSRLNCCRRVESDRRRSSDLTSRRCSSNVSRRHQRMSTSSYFSQMFTASTYFESEYGTINELLLIGARRRESSRSYQTVYGLKRTSIHGNEIVEIYTPRSSLAPQTHYRSFSRPSTVSRVTIQTSGLNRPLYISPSITPHSQLSIHSQNLYLQPRSPSPIQPKTAPIPVSIRPCFSAPRLNPSPAHHLQQTRSISTRNSPKIYRQTAISSNDQIQEKQNLTAEHRRNLMKSTTDQTESSSWLKRSNSSWLHSLNNYLINSFEIIYFQKSNFS